MRVASPLPILSAPVSAARFESPLGRIYVAMDGPSLVALSFCHGIEDFRRLLAHRLGPAITLSHRPDISIFTHLFALLESYFASEPIDFNALSLKLFGTAFDMRVWNAIGKIPYGETANYAGIASLIGSPRACRAVANACGRNILPIVIPCHRVIRSDGRMGGWSGGGGPEVKEKLLAMEGGRLRDGTRQ